MLLSWKNSSQAFFVNLIINLSHGQNTKLTKHLGFIAKQLFASDTVLSGPEHFRRDIDVIIVLMSFQPQPRWLSGVHFEPRGLGLGQRIVLSLNGKGATSHQKSLLDISQPKCQVKDTVPKKPTLKFSSSMALSTNHPKATLGPRTMRWHPPHHHSRFRRPSVHGWKEWASHAAQQKCHASRLKGTSLMWMDGDALVGFIGCEIKKYNRL